MDKQFLMGNDDWLRRSKAVEDMPTAISAGLRRNLILAAMKKAHAFYADFFDIPISSVDFAKQVIKYERDYSGAISLGLFSPGGIREKDHLNLWCLNQLFLPEVYVESGVFIGSSLHAFINSPGIKKIVAIDPNLSNLRLPAKSIPGAQLIDNKDFSQIEIDVRGRKALAYFDDHIDTANRIIQAAQKGFRYVLFDDSTGLEGICQRLYPAIPTIPMIMNVEILSPGDELSWTFIRPSTSSLKNIVNKFILGRNRIRVRLFITQQLIDKCFEARTLIRKYEAIPNLGEFIPQPHPERMSDTSKFLVELEQPGL